MKLLAYKFRLYPNEDQKVLINKTFGCTRKIFNLILNDNIIAYTSTGRSNYPQPTKYKKEFEYLSDVDSLALANARINLQSAFTNFFRNIKKGKNEKGFPKFKSKKNPKQSYTTNSQRNSIRIVSNTIKIPKLGFVKCKFHRKVNGLIKSVTISRNSQNNYFVSILTEQDLVKIKNTNNKILGIDLSFQNFAVLSSGEKINPPKFFYEAEEKIAKLGRKVSKCKLGSNNRQKKRLVKAKFEEHISNKRKDFVHKLSRKLVNEYGIIVVEDINLQHLARHKNWGKTINNLGFGMFRDFLKYKCEAESKIFIKADKFFPSSQLCSKCGFQNKEVKDLAVREWICPKCGAKHDRDINAAINLVQWYIGMGHTKLTPVGDNVRPEVQAIVVESGKVLKQLTLEAPCFS
jgi:putative transposase